MANKKSSKKDIKRSEKRKVTNQAMRSSLKTFIKKVRTATTETVSSNLGQAASALDKAAQNGVIHKRQAARR